MPKPTDRLVTVGMTGSGKTTLVRELIRQRQLPDERTGDVRHVVMVDFKGAPSLNWPGFKICRTLRALIKVGNREPRLTYRPTYEEMTDELTQERVWEYLYRRGQTTIYVDETALVTKGDVFPRYYGACFMQGRERGIEIWSATQRPTRIPAIVLSESEHVYAFRLRLRRDRQRVEELTGIDEDAIASLPKTSFMYAPQEGDIIGPLRLKLPA